MKEGKQTDERARDVLLRGGWFRGRGHRKYRKEILALNGGTKEMKSKLCVCV